MPAADLDTGLLDIGEVAERTGLAPSTLRYYEDRGLIEPAARRGLRRQYRPEVVARLAVVVLCQESRFTLAETRQVLATRGEPGWRQLVARKLEEVRAQITTLEQAADGLAHALDCPSPDVLQCRHFRAHLARVLPARRPGERAVPAPSPRRATIGP